MADGGRLYLLVNQAGKYWWHWKYRLDGEEKAMALAGHPEVSLAEAREAHQAGRKTLATGTDPMAERKQQAQTTTESTFVRLARQ